MKIQHEVRTPREARAALAIGDRELAPVVNEIRTLQRPDGAIAREFRRAARVVRSLREPVRRVLAELGSPGTLCEALEADLDLWLTRGLVTAPCFDRTVAAFCAPENHAAAFFLGPTLCTNGPPPSGRFFEWFVAWREEPAELDPVRTLLPHPLHRCQAMHLVGGSPGFVGGNCLVFFPENVATAAPVRSQHFATFFFNRFRRIYHSETLPRADGVFGPQRWASAALSPVECYRARCLWGYLHDRQHHLGPRPLQHHLQAKLDWHAGVLEELKVDCQSAVLAARHGLPYGTEIVEFILLERMLRYPGHPEATRNFDAATGVLLFEWLLDTGGLRESGGRVTLDPAACLDGMAALAAEIEALERAAPDDDTHRAQARTYVRRRLPRGERNACFALPPRFRRLAGAVEE